MSNIGCEAVALWLDKRFSNLFNQALVVSLFFSFKITSSLLSLVSELETYFSNYKLTIMVDERSFNM